MTDRGLIDSSAKMIAVIREIGIVPLFKSSVSGWSIEELTHPDQWFSTSDTLGRGIGKLMRYKRVSSMGNISQEDLRSPLKKCTGI